ncbi:hypothetical protein MCAMS1_00496 [biofilm metagenome]
MKYSIRLFTIVIFGVIGFAQCVLAHDLPGALGRKLSKAAATDNYSVSCFDDGNGVPDHLSVVVFDKKPRNPAKISAQILLPATGAASDISVDPVDGDGLPGSNIKLVGGAGPYQVNIAKTRSKKKGAEIYFVVFHCESATGTHTGTNEPELIKNQ